jgi:hypothetical protein
MSQVASLYSRRAVAHGLPQEGDTDDLEKGY